MGLLVKPLLTLVCATRSRELFVLFLATWCLGLAAITAHLGMSLALGAFLAGILLADCDHHSQAVAEIEPFRDAFASLFFVSIGMLFNWRTIADAPGTGKAPTRAKASNARHEGGRVRRRPRQPCVCGLGLGLEDRILIKQ